MTPIELVDELVNFIKEVVSDYDLFTKIEGVTKVPSVYPGYLPPVNKENNNGTPGDYPYILVRFLNDADVMNESNTANIRLIIATYSEDEQNGWRDTMNLVDRIKFELREKMFIGPFSLTGKIETNLFEDHPYPYWHAIMDLSFHIPQVQMKWSD